MGADRMERAVGKSCAVRQTIGVWVDLRERRCEMVFDLGGVGMAVSLVVEGRGRFVSEFIAEAGHELFWGAEVVRDLLDGE